MIGFRLPVENTNHCVISDSVLLSSSLVSSVIKTMMVLVANISKYQIKSTAEWFILSNLSNTTTKKMRGIMPLLLIIMVMVYASSATHSKGYHFASSPLHSKGYHFASSALHSKGYHFASSALHSKGYHFDYKDYTGNHEHQSVDYHVGRIRRTVGQRTRCNPKIKTFCKMFKHKKVAEKFCLHVKVKHCTALD